MPAYVLLGDAGAGKTTALKEVAEATRTPLRGKYVTARDFITFDDRPEWHDAVLFIDGLDEVRAGTPDGRAPLDAIRRTLDRLGRPRFRLSCREADWLGASDRSALERVSPDASIKRLHLDPLGENEIRAIVEQTPRIEDAQAFLDGVQRQRLDNLLSNPQTLDMLMLAVSRAGDWPATRHETYDQACRALLEDPNPEHSAAHRAPIPYEDLLQTAGRLCAVQLIAGLAGFALNEDASDRFHPFVSQLDLPFPGDRVRAALGSNLFHVGSVEGQREPTHRSVAEYLAAYHIAGRIDHHEIPLGRVLALITGSDGGAVTALRGLLAWLATLCRSARPRLIERDPVGVILYGDAAEFSTDDKAALLSAVHREAGRYPWFFIGTWNVSPFATIYTLDMAARIRAILAAPSRDDAHQSVAACILEGAVHAEPIPALAAILLEVVRDPTRWGRVRKQALRLTLSSAESTGEPPQSLLELIGDIHAGHVEDPDDELLGILLSNLYPGVLSPERVFELLHVPKNDHFFGSYLWFWEHELLAHSSAQQIAALLDALASAKDLQTLLGDRHRFLNFPGALLAAGLDAAGDRISDDRLYAWLGVGLDEHDFARINKESVEPIRTWLAQRPERYKAVLAAGVHRQQSDHVRAWKRLHTARERLYHATPPADLRRWYLRLAESVDSDEVVEDLLRAAVNLVATAPRDAELSQEDLYTWTERHPRFKKALAKYLVCPIDEQQRELMQSLAQRKEEDRGRRREWVGTVANHETEIRKGAAPATFLNDLAKAYYGYFIEARGDSPVERLSAFLDSRGDLVQAVFEGFRNTLRREDLPTAEDILSLHRKGKEYLIELPYLAGIDEMTHEHPERVLRLDARQIARALTIYFIRGTGEAPPWLAPLLEDRPEQVAAALVETATATLRAKTEHVPGLYALAHEVAYAPVARLATLPLLDVFPLRARGRQLESLNYLLQAALRHSGAKKLLPVIARKLDLSSLTVTQRGYWLAAGLIADPDHYEQRVAAYARGNPRRIQALTGLLSSDRDRWHPTTELPASAVGLLIELLGSQYAPSRLPGAHWVTPGMEAADLVRSLIEQLGSDPGESASRELQRLGSMPPLEAWHDTLRSAKYRQTVLRRDAEFAHPDLHRVNRTLAGGEPANPADLAALTLDVINEIAHEIRSANTNDYKQYWNVDKDDHPVTPKPENAGRNALLSDLKERLAPFNVDAQPEGHYAEDTRADIRVSFGGAAGINIPIEIKRDSHRDLWTAIRTQLIGQYTGDPGAQGYGIYLVFWFAHRPPHSPPSGVVRLRTALDLETALRDTLPEEERRRIFVRVIDCSRVNR